MGPATAKDGNIHIPSSSVATLERREVERVATVPVHSQFAESLRAARAAGIIGAEVFTGKVVRGRILPMKKKALAAKFKKYAVLVGINDAEEELPWRAQGARRGCSLRRLHREPDDGDSWTDLKMPAHYIAKANREKLGMSGMDKTDGVRSETNHSMISLSCRKKWERHAGTEW
jgi:hypothetical protein